MSTDHENRPGTSGRGDQLDPYEALGVGRSATHAQIVSAYRRAVRRLHPDTHRTDQSRTEQPATSDNTVPELQDVLAAYAIGSPTRRAAYDRRHPVEQPEPTNSAGSRRPRPRPSGVTSDPEDPPIRIGPVRYHPPP